MYDSGVKDDKLSLLFNINTPVTVAVKTPVGKSKRESIYNVITQGDVFGDIPFGKHYFEVVIILRVSLLVSSVLFNSEAW